MGLVYGGVPGGIRTEQYSAAPRTGVQARQARHRRPATAPMVAGLALAVVKRWREAAVTPCANDFNVHCCLVANGVMRLRNKFRDQLRQFGSGRRANTHAGTVNVAFDGTH